MDIQPIQNEDYDYYLYEFKKILKKSKLDNCLKKITYGDNLEFNYYDFKNINLSNQPIISQQLFNYNIFLIVDVLTKYFKQININLRYDFPNRNEFILKEYDMTLRNNIYVEFNFGGKYFECGFDFVQKTHNINEYKYLSSIVNLDYYKYFDEDFDNVNVFMDECIYRMLVILCSLNNDEFKLAEILFIRSNANLPNLKIQLEIYNKIIYGKKNKFVNLYDFYDEIMPINIETGSDMCYGEFINYIQNNIFDGQKINICENNLLSWDDFELIILNLDKNISLNISCYKKVYTQSINTLILALKTINDLIQQINKTKKDIPQYIQELMSNDIVNFQNKELLKNVYKQLENYFSNI